MNERYNKLLQYNTSGLGCWLTIALLAILITTVGLGWAIKGLFIFLAFLLIAPIVAVWGLQWWLKRKLVQDQCPVCNYEFTGFKNTEFSCPNCGEALEVTGDRFIRMTPPGTIDVDAVEVSVQSLEDRDA